MHLTLLLGAFKIIYWVSAVKILFLHILLFVVFSRSLFIGRSRERCNEKWHYVIQLVFTFFNVFFKVKHLFLLSLHLVDN